eukprot:Lithocolla_globosa_v1_NODE_8951_length_764_cov_2.808181.p2 type:complete len:107 gc:universal NODE_8951_length_764_cov_2.808181:546-226(-)
MSNTVTACAGFQKSSSNTCSNVSRRGAAFKTCSNKTIGKSKVKNTPVNVGRNVSKSSNLWDDIGILAHLTTDPRRISLVLAHTCDTCMLLHNDRSACMEANFQTTW